MTNATAEKSCAAPIGATAFPSVQRPRALLNSIRAAKIRSAADLATLGDIVADSGLKLELARHAAVEAQHAYLLTRRMAELGLQAVRPPAALNGLELLLDASRARDVKQVYSQSTAMADADLMEVVVALWIWHRRASVKLSAHVETLIGDADTAALLRKIAVEQERYGEYLGRWREWFERRFSRRAVMAVQTRLEAVLAPFAQACLQAAEDGRERPAA